MIDHSVFVDGQALSIGQKLALRSAIVHLRTELNDQNALGDDEQGKLTAQAYRDRLDELLRMLD